jgi:DNA helicase-2/ATP-dependent DNA helicase PcrA
MPADFFNFEADFANLEELQSVIEQRFASAKLDLRAALSTFETTADVHQKAVIDSGDRTIRLVAPAGAGKTQTIINRILKRVHEGTDPKRFLILTFDNAAVSSLQAKLAEQLAHQGVDHLALAISTLNAYGYRLLWQYMPDEAKDIVERYQQIGMMRHLRAELKRSHPDRDAALPEARDRYFLDIFSYLKNEVIDPRGVDPKEFGRALVSARAAGPFFPDSSDKTAVSKTLSTMLWLFQHYDDALDAAKKIDLDDQKLRPYAELMENTALASSIQGKYSEIIVDEFQDINRLDFVLIKLIAAKARLVVVGDDDQAIYGFRGCSPDYIIDLDKHLGREHVSHELQINYRCPPNIVEASTLLIRHNKRRIPKAPTAYRSDGSPVKIIHSSGAAVEAKAIVTLIQRMMRAKKELRFNDFALLYRTNAQSLPLQIEFILADIPYHVRKEDNILANDSLPTLVGTLRAKVELQDGEQPIIGDQLAVFDAYFRYIDAADRDKLSRFLARADTFESAVQSEGLLNTYPKANGNFLEAVEELLAAKDLRTTLDVLARRFRGLRGMIGSLEDAVQEQVPLGEIYEIAASFKGDTTQFVKTLEAALQRARDIHAGDDEENGVALRTYFKAKGLQWHTVILCSCNEGLIPHSKAPIDEERRLFYVAMTRASANLICSYVKRSVNKKVAPSRFLSEAGLIGSTAT